MPDYTQARQNMVVSQLQPNGVLTQAILDRFAALPRELFVPTEYRAMAYADTGIDLGQGRAALAPMVLARLIETATPARTDRALCLGGNMGYGGGVLAGLVDQVVDFEPDPRFTSLFNDAQNRAGVRNINRVNTIPAGPFDVVVFEAATAEPPLALARQVLAPLGRMVVVVVPDGARIGSVNLLTKSATGHVSTRVVFDAYAPYLPGYEPTRRFAFS